MVRVNSGNQHINNYAGLMQAPGKVDTHLRAGGETRTLDWPGMNSAVTGEWEGVDLLRKDPGI